MTGANAVHEPRLARVAALVADPARSRMLALLMSGEAATAGELARAASVTPPTASSHLAKLADGGLVTCEQRGRHRYFRLAGEDVARALEALALVAEAGERVRHWSHPQRQALRRARCCYGHLAGELGVALHESLLARGLLVQAPGGYELSEAGRAWIMASGVELPASSQRRFAYPCMDWSERRDHLAGELADALLRHFFQRDWLRRTKTRAVSVTPAGERALLPMIRVG